MSQPLEVDRSPAIAAAASEWFTRARTNTRDWSCATVAAYSVRAGSKDWMKGYPCTYRSRRPASDEGSWAATGAGGDSKKKAADTSSAAARVVSSSLGKGQAH